MVPISLFIWWFQILPTCQEAFAGLIKFSQLALAKPIRFKVPGWSHMPNGTWAWFCKQDIVAVPVWVPVNALWGSECMCAYFFSTVHWMLVHFTNVRMCSALEYQCVLYHLGSNYCKHSESIYVSAAKIIACKCTYMMYIHAYIGVYAHSAHIQCLLALHMPAFWILWIILYLVWPNQW